MVAGTWDDYLYVFQAVGNTYNLIQTMSSASDLDGVDITGDGEFFASIVYSTSAHAYERQSNGQFTEIQKFVSGSGRYKAIGVTQDKQLFYYGTGNQVYVAIRSGSTYTALTTLGGMANYISDIKITTDKQYIAIASMSQFNIFFYNTGSRSFTQLQETVLGGMFWHMKIEITDDHQYLTTNFNSNVYMYKWNGGGFSLWQSWTGRSSSPYHALPNYDQNVLVICQTYKTDIYRIYPGGTNELLQTIEGSKYARMNQNNSFLFLANNDRISVYIHCQSNTGYVYDPSTFGCSCDTANDYEILGDGLCGICNFEGCLQCYSSGVCTTCD